VHDAATGSVMLQVGESPFRDSSSILAVAWSPDGEYMAAPEGETVRVCAARTGHVMFATPGHSRDVWAVSWHPNGRRLASLSADGAMRVWDTTNGDLLFSISPGSPAYCVRWSPDGRCIASSSGTEMIHLWDATSYILLAEWQNKGGYVNSLAWAPDSRL